MKCILVMAFSFWAVCHATRPTVKSTIANATSETKPENNAISIKISPSLLVPIGDKLYYIEKNLKVNWFTALNFCQANDMKLISIQTAKEQDDLTKHLAALSTHFWMSLYNLAKKDEWVWAGTGTRATYFNWELGQPDNKGGNEHCGELTTDEGMKWNDAKCDLEASFICEQTTERTPENSDSKFFTKAFAWAWMQVFRNEN